MAASYPSSAKTFVTRAVGHTIQPAHVNDLQDEVTAVEQDLLAGLPISRGGTGATTQAAAFGALAPSTTLGDLIAYDGSAHVRLPVGTDGQVLGASSAEASGLAWVAGGGLATAYQYTYSTQLQRSSANGTDYLPILSLTCTPQAATHIVLVQWALPVYVEVGTTMSVQVQQWINGVAQAAAATWTSATGPDSNTVTGSLVGVVLTTDAVEWVVSFRYVSGPAAVYGCYGNSTGTLSVLEFRA